MPQVFKSWRSALPLLVTLATLAGVSGCGVMGYRLRSPLHRVEDTRIGPGNLTSDGIQSEVMSFADSFTAAVAQRWNEAGSARPAQDAAAPSASDTPQPDPTRARRSAHERKLASVSAALSIAASPNPLVALSDMITLVTLERMRVEEPATAELFGEEATEKLLATYREHEEAVWRIGKRAFTPKQQKELRDLIAEWRAAHADQRYVSQVRLEDFAAARQQQVTTDDAHESLLSLVMLDPFAGLDPAKREIQESRMLGTRAFFYMARMPTLLKWQTESLYEGFLHNPEVRDGLNAFTQFSEAADRISKTAEQFPQERKAALDQFFAGVAEQREGFLKDLDQGQDELKHTLGDFRETVEATNTLAQSLTTTAQAIESMADRVMPPPGESSAAPGKDRLGDYQVAAEKTAVAAERLTVLAGKVEQLLDPATLDQRTSAVQRTVEDAQAGAEDVIDHAFTRALILIVVAPLVILLAAVAYRWLSARRPMLDRSIRGPYDTLSVEQTTQRTGAASNESLGTNATTRATRSRS